MPDGSRRRLPPIPRTELSDGNEGSPPESVLAEKDAQDHKWAWCREKIVWLYWEQNLPLNRVQEIMRRENGLRATAKQYKRRFKKWGIRKNLNVGKARELASAQGAVSDFWPDTRQREYERRIARHLRNDAKGRTTTPPDRPGSLARQQRIVPRPCRLKSPDELENLEKTLFNAELYVHFTINPSRTWLASRAELGQDDRFFPLFIDGLDSLSRDHEPHRAFEDISNAFNHLQGLVILDDPSIYHRLVARLSSFENHPTSEICFKVCQLLARCLRALYLETHGASHPLNSVWSSHVEALESRPQPGFFHHYLDTFRTIGRKFYGNRNSLNIGSTDLSKYVSSSVRGWGEESLRGALEESASPASPGPVSHMQDIRLALAELLLCQRKPQAAVPEEALQLLAKATALRHSGSGGYDQLFWMAELHWRAGNADESFAMLEEALELADRVRVRPGLVGGALEEDSRLPGLHILHTLLFRLSLLGRTNEYSEALAGAAPLLAARRDRKPFVLHLTNSDLEFELDTKFNALAITD